ncbi:MAG: outer membrane beta-barrel family protein [Pedobacter sp.]
MTSRIILLNDQQSAAEGLNGSLGVDYALTTFTTVGMQVSLSTYKRNVLLDYDSKSFNAGDQLDSLSAGNTRSLDDRTNVGLNLNLAHNFGKSGKELSFDASYLRYNGDGDQNTNDQFLYLLPSDSRIYTVKGDYVHPLKNKAKLEAGFKSSLVNNNNIANYYLLNGSAPLLDNTRSNDFNYTENINAAYLNGQKAWKAWSVQVGLRVENTNASGKQFGNADVAESNFSRSYTQFFPGVAFMYKLDSTNTRSLSLVLSRRINRPNYQNLNPFVFFRDKYSYTVGNPMLRAQAQYRYELKYQHQRWLRFGVSYNHFIDVILPTTTVIDDIFYTKQDNIGQGYMILFNTGLNVPVTEWWTANSDIQLSNIGLKGKTTQSIIHFSTYIARFNLNNQFNFKGGWAAEAGGYYASRDYNGQTFTSGMYRVNAGIQKKIWNDKASIRLNFDDIFNSWVYNNGSVGLGNAQYFQTTRTDTQRVGLAFTYRFGSDSFARKSKHQNNASEDERGRMQ